MQTYNDYWVDNYLSHYGVLGMRWRKRKGYSNYTRSVIQRNKIEQERAMKKLQSPKINSNKVSSMTRRLDNGLDMEHRSKQMDKLEKIFANKKDKKGKYRSARKITKDLENELERLTGEKRNKYVQAIKRAPILVNPISPAFSSILGGGSPTLNYNRNRNLYVSKGSLHPYKKHINDVKVKRKNIKTNKNAPWAIELEEMIKERKHR